MKRFESQTYYVKHPTNGWFAYVTVTAALNLLQIHSDFGIYAIRWNAAGPDFEAFLMRLSTDYLEGCLESTVSNTVSLTTKAASQQVQRRLRTFTEALWPLFIEALKQETAVGEVS